MKVCKIKAPVKKGDVIGTAEIIDSGNNIIDEVDVTIDKDIEKAGFVDYLLKNLKMVASGKTLLKQ